MKLKQFHYLVQELNSKVANQDKINIGQTNQGTSHTPFCLRRDFPYTKSNFLTVLEVQIFSLKNKKSRILEQ